VSVTLWRCKESKTLWYCLRTFKLQADWPWKILKLNEIVPSSCWRASGQELHTAEQQFVPVLRYAKKLFHDYFQTRQEQVFSCHLKCILVV